MEKYQSLEEIKRKVPEQMLSYNPESLERISDMLNLQLEGQEEKRFVDTCNYFKKHIRSKYHSRFITTYAYLLQRDDSIKMLSNKEKLILAVPFLEEDWELHPIVTNKEILKTLSEIIPETELSSIDQIDAIFNTIEERAEEIEPDSIEIFYSTLKEELQTYQYQDLKEAWNIHDVPSEEVLKAVHQMNPKL